MPDISITCESCSQPFVLTDQQQAYYTENAYTMPTKCDACTQKQKAERDAERASRKPKKKRRW